MIKFAVATFVLYTLFLGKNIALQTENYTAYIEELSHDERFLEEYTKWSSKLFSQPDYLYGNSHEHFSCLNSHINEESKVIPKSVHALRPRDIKCVATMGDSLVTGLGANAITPVGLLMENRGISWSSGGDYTYSKLLSLPNILRQYNSKLEGFSSKVSAMFFDYENTTANGLNIAKSGDYSSSMIDQADMLIHRLKNDKLCDWHNDWKIITIFVGNNDLCSFCEDSNGTKYTPEQYLTHIRDTLDKLYNSSLPRTLINLVLAFDIRIVKNLNSGSYICKVLHKGICPCAASPTAEKTKILDDYILQYHKLVFELISSQRYDDREDFTVVIQPFMAKIRLPYKDNHKIDFSYFAPDCFHFSGKGHSSAAVSLWNNMLEPVGGKKRSWHFDESLKCPTEQYPYIFTWKNSAKALEELKHTTVTYTTHSYVIIDNNNNNTNISTSDDNATAKHHHKHHEDASLDSDFSFSKIKFITIISFLIITIAILFVGFSRRRKVRLLIPNNEQGHSDGIINTQYHDDNDELEVWSRNNIKVNYSDRNATSTLHDKHVPAK